MKKRLVAMTTLMLVAVLATGCAQVPSVPTPTSPTPTSPTPALSEAPAPMSTPAGEEVNFRLLLSDEVNAIDDFDKLWVIFEGEDVAGATVEVNGEELDSFTGEDGKITFTIPADADELEIEAKKEEVEGEPTTRA